MWSINEHKTGTGSAQVNSEQQVAPGAIVSVCLRVQACLSSYHILPQVMANIVAPTQAHHYLIKTIRFWLWRFFFPCTLNLICKGKQLIWFLEFFCQTFLLNVDYEHSQNLSCPKATFIWKKHLEKLQSQGRFPVTRDQVTHFPQLSWGNEKSYEQK